MTALYLPVNLHLMQICVLQFIIFYTRCSQVLIGLLICQLIIQLAHDVENETLMLHNIGLCNNITDLSIMTLLLVFITIIERNYALFSGNP